MTDKLDECMNDADPLLRDMYDAWQAAFDVYRTYPKAAVAEHDDTTAANCIRCHMWAEVVRRFGEQPGFLLRNENGLKLLLYRDRFVFRFKKVDGTGRHHNYPTAQQDDFDKDEELPGIPPQAVRLTCGYQPDPSGLAIERVIIAKRFGASADWTAQINDVSGAIEWTDITPVRFDGTTRFERKDKK